MEYSFCIFAAQLPSDDVAWLGVGSVDYSEGLRSTTPEVLRTPTP
jgi:hypothetical protein